MTFRSRVAGATAVLSATGAIGLLIASAPGIAANDPATPVIARAAASGAANPALMGSLSTDLAVDVAHDAAAAVSAASAAAAPADTTIVDTVSAASPLNFSSLAAAVSAQVRPAEVTGELACLAHATYYESKGEPLEGQLAVAEVIVNRAESGRFASTLCGVVKQRGQFSFVRGGNIPEPNRASPAWREALAVAQVALDDHWDSRTEGALFFHARRVSPGWKLKRVGTVGNHVFYR